MSRVFVVVFCVGSFVGCPVASEGEGEGDVGEGEGDVVGEGEGEVINDDPPGDASIAVGAFAVTMNTDDARSALLGKVFDGPTPSGVQLDVTATAGACRLRVPRVPFCNVPCGAALCVDDDVCQEFPTSQSVGRVTVTGLTTTPFTIDPIANSYQPSADTALAFPIAAPGAAFTIDARGSAFSRPFVLEGHSFAPLVVDDAPLALTRGQDFVVNYDAGDDALARVQLKLDISHHGGTKGVIDCDDVDDGSVVVEASLVDALLDLGVAGFPGVIVTRSSTSNAVIGVGRIDLVVSSNVERIVDVDGLNSCLSDDDCTAPLTCQSDLVCR